VYLTVRGKFAVATAVSLLWFAFSLWVALPWMRDLAEMGGWLLSIIIVGGIALLPGLMNAFIAISLLLDQRPYRAPSERYPGVSVLIAAYNERDWIARTLQSIERQDYAGDIEVIVIDDSSTDDTAAVVEAEPRSWLRLLRLERNMGKAAALNRGLAAARHDLIVTIDADSYLYGDALRHIVERYCTDPPGTRAVAGTMLVGNSRDTWVTRAQEWDYFHGIAAVKRMQSMYHGTLVAQGAFSLYERSALEEVGGWTNVVGEDIVLTWALLEQGYRIGHAEDACCFTQAPARLGMFVRQRQRWARGMLEAFRLHPRILRVFRMSTFFIVWNLFFPWLDATYTLVFIPGVILACFGIYWIVGPMTLALLPMALLINLIMFRVGKRMFRQQDLRVRRNVAGFIIYVLAYSAILQPASVAGYLSEVFGLRKSWGTK
jgi:poly-beta-1,6-N-acetyl-D-glucosamine synthase